MLCFAFCCTLLLSAALCCSLLLSPALGCSLLLSAALCCSLCWPLLLLSAALCCSVLLSAALCSMLLSLVLSADLCAALSLLLSAAICCYLLCCSLISTFFFTDFFRPKLDIHALFSYFSDALSVSPLGQVQAKKGPFWLIFQSFFWLKNQALQKSVFFLQFWRFLAIFSRKMSDFGSILGSPGAVF